MYYKSGSFRVKPKHEHRVYWAGFGVLMFFIVSAATAMVVGIA